MATWLVPLMLPAFYQPRPGAPAGYLGRNRGLAGATMDHLFSCAGSSLPPHGHAVQEAHPMSDHHGISRRHVLGMAIAAGGFTVSGVVVGSSFAQSLKRTPGEILGPFYPVLRS